MLIAESAISTSPWLPFADIGLSFGPLLGGVQNGNDGDRFSIFDIDHLEMLPHQHLACTVDATCRVHPWKSGQLCYFGHDVAQEARGRVRVLVCDVLDEDRQVSSSFWRPVRWIHDACGR